MMEPWSIEDRRGRANNLLRVVDARGRGVARINGRIDATEIATLVAAAPALEYALAECLDILAAQRRKPPVVKGAIRTAQAALKLARGEAA